jgi:peptidoglycan hydrolase CwlO-like protein
MTLVEFPAMTNLTSVLNQLERERTRLISQLESLNNALSALNAKEASHRGRISGAGRARIAVAQRARWAKARRAKVVPIRSRPKRKMSAAAIARIRAAQKARWAKWRKQQKSA